MEGVNDEMVFGPSETVFNFDRKRKECSERCQIPRSIDQKSEQIFDIPAFPELSLMTALLRRISRRTVKIVGIFYLQYIKTIVMVF